MSYVIKAADTGYFNQVTTIIRNVEVGTDPAGDNVERGLFDMGDKTKNYASSITHQWTATLYRSYLLDIGAAGNKAAAQVFVDPNAMNPFGQRPAVYAPFEFARGGSHDAFGLAFKQANPAFVISGIEVILDGIKE